MSVQRNLQRALVDQFHHPRGVLGSLAGRIMARRESNLARNRWTVDLLDLASGDRVLELGPGPGVTLGVILERVPAGFVVGVDHSATMLAQCRRANRAALRDERLALIQGSFTQLPELHGPFDAILAVNSLQFDALKCHTLAQIARLLKPGGSFAITFQPRGAHPSDAKAMAHAEHLVQLLERAGITQTRIEKLPLEPVCAVCVLARK
jgi:ubiquinone/menaquinone biosynthesis C-methylase UbiE